MRYGVRRQSCVRKSASSAANATKKPLCAYPSYVGATCLVTKSLHRLISELAPQPPPLTGHPHASYACWPGGLLLSRHQLRWMKPPSSEGCLYLLLIRNISPLDLSRNYICGPKSAGISAFLGRSFGISGQVYCEGAQAPFRGRGCPVRGGGKLISGQI